MIKTELGLTSPISITEGLMQGEISSPLLFCLYINDIADILNNSGISGLDISPFRILHLLMFADDMVLIAPTPRALQLKINLLHKYLQKHGLKVNIDKTKVMVFRRGGKLDTGLSFHYNQQLLEIVNEYTYLGVIFSSFGVFKKAAMDFKKKGSKAIGCLWNLFCKNKLDNWDAHYKLFNSIAVSTVLYASHVWSHHYLLLIEQIQTAFIKRLFLLERQVANYAIRIETGCLPLEFNVIKQTLNFVIRILSQEGRIAKLIFKALVTSSENDKDKYNWTLNFKSILTRGNASHLWKCFDAGEFITAKAGILETITVELKNKDIQRASESLKYNYCVELTDLNRLISIKNCSINRIRIVAQTRMNYSKFRYKDKSHVLNIDESCCFCNINTNEDLFHFLFECTIHNTSRNIFISKFTNANRDNFQKILLNITTEDVLKIFNYVVCSLQRRSVFLNLMNY